MTLPYREGSVFLVPLQQGGFAYGVVARTTDKGKVVFGYFFGPRIQSKEAADFEHLKPVNAVKRIRFGDLGLINGEWPILGVLPNWNRSQWTMPDFVRRDPLNRLKPIRVHYSDSDPSQVEWEMPIENDSGLDTDSLSGYGAVETKLSKLL